MVTSAPRRASRAILCGRFRRRLQLAPGVGRLGKLRLSAKLDLELTMPRFLFHYLELFSYIGEGTPHDPGGDFSMFCWIEAPNHEEALAWGHVLLGDYHQKRFAHSEDADRYDGTPVVDGEIETDQATLADMARKFVIPECVVGAIPEWDAPWESCNLKGVE
jgi:hypothetical protein